jgi:hypothetical protein
MNMFRFTVFLLILFSCEAFSRCRNWNDVNNRCRYPEGDSWCEKNYKSRIYAYRNDCDLEQKPTAQNDPKKTRRKVDRYRELSAFLSQNKIQVQKDNTRIRNPLKEYHEKMGAYDGFGDIFDILKKPQAELDPALLLGNMSCGETTDKKQDLNDSQCEFSSPATWVEAKHIDYCNNFLPDYFHYLKFSDEVLKHGASEYHKKPWSTKGSLFYAAWAVLESGWSVSYEAKRGNFWGLGGASRFLSFENFKKGFSYKVNHMAYGIESKGMANDGHPGWPDALKIVVEGSDFTNDEMNKALRSGPYCEEGLAYNYDKNEDGKCMDYAAYLQKLMLTTLKICTKVWEDHPFTEKSYLYPNSTMQEKQRRFEKTYLSLKDYAIVNHRDLFCKEDRLLR